MAYLGLRFPNRTPYIWWLLLVVFFHGKLEAQIVITPAPRPEGFLALDDIWRISILNVQGQDIMVYVEAQVEDQQHNVILSGRTQVFLLRTGLNKIQSSILPGVSQYGYTNTSRAVRQSGRFPFGNYIVCYSVHEVERNNIIGNHCQEETVKPFSPPELIAPFDHEDIYTISPILTWKPPMPPGNSPIVYRLKLVEVKDKQDAIAAIEENFRLVDREIYNSTVLVYPNDGLKLEFGKSYAWQVEARTENFDLGFTQVWIFTVTNEEAKSSMVPTGSFKTFRELKKYPDGSFNPVQANIQFYYSNRFNAPALKSQPTEFPVAATDSLYYRIYPEGRRDTPLSASSAPVLKPGINKIKIPTNTITGLTDGKNYVLLLREPTGVEYYLEFVYYE